MPNAAIPRARPIKENQTGYPHSRNFKLFAGELCIEKSRGLTEKGTKIMISAHNYSTEYEPLPVWTLDAMEEHLRLSGRIPSDSKPNNVIVLAANPETVQAEGVAMRRRFQTGKIIKRGKNPMWCGIFREDVQQPTGKIKRVQRCVTLGLVRKTSRRAAEKLFQPHLDRVNADAINLPPKSGTTLESFVNKKWLPKVAVNLKPSTVRAAKSHLRTHIIPKLGTLLLTELSPEIVQDFVTHLGTEANLCRKTVENVVLTLSSIVGTARDWNYACGGFTFKALTLPTEGVKVEQRSFTDREIGRILKAATEPLATIVAVTAELGLRIGETLALGVKDIDFDNRVIRIRQGIDADTREVQSLKTDGSSATVPMPPKLATRLRSFLKKHGGKSPLLFVNRRGRPYSANKLREKLLHPLLEKLGIPRGGFHAMRHGACSALIGDGANIVVVQKQLRHSTSAITANKYAHIVDDQQRKAVAKRSARIARYAA
jgi:integrase